MEGKHTKGPWYYENYAGYYLIQSEAGYSDTDILNEDKTDKAEANAKLAATAPDLLEALKFCKSVIFHNGIFDLSEKMAYEKAGSAIKKATE